MANQGVFLSLDAGSGGGRCLIVDARGTQLASSYRAWQFHAPPGVPMGAEFDPGEVFGTLCRVAHEAMETAGVLPDEVLGIGCTSFRDGVVFLDDHGREIYAGTNRDARALIFASEMQRKWGELITPIAGRTPLGLDAAAHLIWYKRQRPDEFARIRHLLMVSDWIVWKLTREYTADPSNSSSSLLFDVNKCCWSDSIAEALGVSLSILPKVKYPGELAGYVTEKAAKELGVTAGTPVSVGIGDSQAGCLGCGAIEEGETTVVAGTTIPVQMALAKPLYDPARRIWTGAHGVRGRWVLEANGGPAGTVYSWVRRNIYPDISVDEFSAYHHINELAAKEKPGQVFAFLGPQVCDLSKLSFPPMIAVLAPTMGGDIPVTRSGIARAALENIAFTTKANILQCEAVSKMQSKDIYVCGGLSRSRLFVQILADALERSVKVPSIRETTALGAAMAAATAAGIYPDILVAAREMSKTEYVAEPVSDSVKKYRVILRRWEALRTALPR